MKRYILFIIILFISTAVFTQTDHAPEGKPAMLFPEMGNHNHPVSTQNAEAQKYFNQGLTFIYAFNHDEAVKSFKKALELDPNMVMAYWGIAYALGPNINLDVDPEREKAAYDAVQKALATSANAPDNECAYIETLSKRYSNDPKADLKKLAVEYKDAMKALVARYPDDLDLAVLYADSLMNLRPWKLWDVDGKPAEGTEEIVSVLESVLKRDPDHVGANHLYIHAVEASLNPEKALPSAKRLETLVPAAGHLVHMPAHIYSRVGSFDEAAKRNEVAMKADENYFQMSGVTQGFYPMMYYNHNIHFLYYARAMEGRFADAKKAADQVTANAMPHVKEMAMLDGFTPTSILVLLRFRKYDDILKVNEPGEGMPFTKCLWRYAKAIAYSRTGRIGLAEKEQTAFEDAAKVVPADAVVSLSPASIILNVAALSLRAEIALSKKNPDAAEWFRKAVEAQDAIQYDEPPDWYYPIRESYGAVLLRGGRSEEAEKVFRKDLEKNPRNGRSLFGLMESLKAQGKTSDAAWVKQQFEDAWKNADTKLRLEDL
jgi:tetratricopeptide (TPR) repeat protein